MDKNKTDGNKVVPIYEKESKIYNSFCLLKKRKAVHSNRKIYSSNLTLYDKDEKENIYRDSDIGFYKV